PVPLTSPRCGASVASSSDLAEVFAAGGFELGTEDLEKSPAAAMPLAFIVLTQFSIVGTTLPAAVRSNWRVCLFAVAASWCDLRKALIACADITPPTIFLDPAVAEI